MEQLPSSPEWGWLKVTREGDDLVVRGVRATNFGHKRDSEDSGVGSCGWETANNPDVPVVALPCKIKIGRLAKQFGGSPIPQLRVKSPARDGQKVRVFCPATGKSVVAELADQGPSLYVVEGGKRRYLKTAIDLSEATVRALGLTLAQGEYTVDFRIIDGAKKL